MAVRRFVIVGYDAAELLDIACVTSSLIGANLHGAAPPYEVCLATPGGHPITCASGLTLQAQEALERITGPLDTLMVSGGIGHEAAAADRLIVAHVRRLARESRRVASVCTGAWILAAAGLLNGRRVTTHWREAQDLAVRHPEVVVDADPIFIRDGNVATAAGVTSALDLTLAFIEEDHGVETARWVARHLVTYLQRPGNQAQMSMFTAAPPPSDGLVRQIVDHITAHLDADLSTAGLAALAGVSERHLTRLFLKHLGRTPGRFVRQARTEAAAHLLASTTLPMTGVAARCGFGTTETLRQAFVAHYGIPPSQYRLTQSST
ncbi:Transcriptional regulator GlxA family, contains an amidase domain and an AraC-type DNA-binding HTH domain [Thermomonospora echinospora]|uniref:Transcriptional regulator GlxA family, contains an amidase domain and an AraC-type DNA-binding HTH domain n=1 Tax=Thermomonospora echinospora TaxID=1992 RepID=A0A1H5YIY5_9ACTN|nr:DJ-1/PfpI family protein [Thermomonospora echinospora]SEG24061.1 Transcriptional regulator GlxA family, contains an amidase domain and an AraC-type DNA-binding HTH domain [Thermomonospora echinospora]